MPVYRDRIIELMSLPPDRKDALYITPQLDLESIGDIGIDLRLSNQFIVFNADSLCHIDFLDSSEGKERIRKYQKYVVVPPNKPFILHPNTLVLGSTLEFVSMPNNHSGSIDGRSSWARHGLIIATACAIDPGFKGTITLELTNLGESPLYLYPGVRVIQLFLENLGNKARDYSKGCRKYRVQVGPEFSKIHDDREMPILRKMYGRSH